METDLSWLLLRSWAGIVALQAALYRPKGLHFVNATNSKLTIAIKTDDKLKQSRETLKRIQVNDSDSRMARLAPGFSSLRAHLKLGIPRIYFS